MQGMNTQGAPIIVLNMTTKRENGRSAQLSNIKAGKVKILFKIIGSIFSYQNHSWSKINVKNAFRPHWWDSLN